MLLGFPGAALGQFCASYLDWAIGAGLWLVLGPEFSLTELSPALAAAVRQEGEPWQCRRGGSKAGGLAERCPALLAPSAVTRDQGNEWWKHWERLLGEEIEP